MAKLVSKRENGEKRCEIAANFQGLTWGISILRPSGVSGSMRKLDQTVVLVGMMGAGKTSVGRRLASVLGVPFKDADSEIEAAAGCSINEIFERFGEPAFRAGERKVIARILGDPPHVLATGGGAFMDPETRARITETAVSIWLRANVDLLLERVKRKDNRPLLRNTDNRTALVRLIAEREPVYAQADIVVESDDGPHDTVVKRIISALQARGAMTENGSA
jgi:shikimate kinase